MAVIAPTKGPSVAELLVTPSAVAPEILKRSRAPCGIVLAVSSFVHLLAMRLPGTRTRAIALLALFSAVQMADGVMTFTAVERYGRGIEGNPLLALAMGAYGTMPALVGAKLLAVALAVVLHLKTRHAAVAALTATYVFAALGPWAWILS